MGRALALWFFLLAWTPPVGAASFFDLPELAQLAQRKMEIASRLAEQAASCVVRKDTDHIGFHGCVDWHSSVHGVWALVAYTRVSGDRRYVPLIERALTPEKITAERRFIFERPTFEMPYGRAWFLRLALEHRRTFQSDLLRPMARDIAASLIAHYQSQPPDPRSRSYDNAAWALLNLRDWAESEGDGATLAFVNGIVRAHFWKIDRPCLLENEGPTFMAACANWAWLVAKVVTPEDFHSWLPMLLPPDAPIRPVSLPRNAHEEGMNFSRAWGLWGLYAATRDLRFAQAYVRHFLKGYEDPRHWSGDYHRVGHWVAQFGMFALLPLFDGPP